MIGQQWAWTFRYPQFGGFETTQLALPVNQPVQFNVTSLDVIHSFWAYTLGVKADANPGVNNVAYTTPNTVGDFQVRCAELCGIWHGAMYDTGAVMTDSNFMAWTQTESVKLASVTKLLPPYALTYDPTNIPAWARSTRPSASPARAAVSTTRRTRNSRRNRSEETHMAIETQPDSAHAPGGGDPGATPTERSWWLRPNILTALVCAVSGYYLGHWLGNFIGSQYQQVRHAPMTTTWRSSRLRLPDRRLADRARRVQRPGPP